MTRRRKKNIYWGAFILGWFEHLRNSDLTASDYRVLFFLCENMDFNGNKVYLKQKEVAEKLHMDKGNVSKCIKKLCNKQFIVKVSSGFMINPHLFYVGKSHPVDRIGLREEFDETIINKGKTPLFKMDEFDSMLKYGDEIVEIDYDF